MKVSKFKMFLKLYQKEMKELKLEILLTVIAVVIATLLVFISSSSWPMLLLIMIAGLAGFLPLITASKTFSKEFNDNTIYLIMSLPIRGSLILGSKLAAVVTQYLVGTISVIISLASLALFLEKRIGTINIYENLPWELLASIYLTTITFGIFLVVVIFFSQIISKLVPRFQGLTTIVVIIGLFWVTNKLISPIIWHSKYSPGLNYIPIEPFLYTSLSYTLTALVLFIVAALIYDRRVEL